jgi:hypothetical protein
MLPCKRSQFNLGQVCVLLSIAASSSRGPAMVSHGEQTKPVPAIPSAAVATVLGQVR